MHSRHPGRQSQNEPKVIAIAATKTAAAPALAWASGIALLAYTWCALLVQ